MSNIGNMQSKTTNSRVVWCHTQGDVEKKPSMIVNFSVAGLANLSKTCKYTAVWHHDRGSVGKKPSLVVTFRASYQTKEYKSGPVIEEDNHALAEWAEDLRQGTQNNRELSPDTQELIKMFREAGLWDDDQQVQPPSTPVAVSPSTPAIRENIPSFSSTQADTGTSVTLDISGNVLNSSNTKTATIPAASSYGGNAPSLSRVPTYSTPIRGTAFGPFPAPLSSGPGFEAPRLPPIYSPYTHRNIQNMSELPSVNAFGPTFQPYSNTINGNSPIRVPSLPGFAPQNAFENMAISQNDARAQWQKNRITLNERLLTSRNITKQSPSPQIVIDLTGEEPITMHKRKGNELAANASAKRAKSSSTQVRTGRNDLTPEQIRSLGREVLFRRQQSDFHVVEKLVFKDQKRALFREKRALEEQNQALERDKRLLVDENSNLYRRNYELERRLAEQEGH